MLLPSAADSVTRCAGDRRPPWFRPRRRAAAPSPRTRDSRWSDPGSCSGGWSGRTVLGLSRTDAVLRVPSAAVVVLARFLLVDERPEDLAPGAVAVGLFLFLLNKSRIGFPSVALHDASEARASGVTPRAYVESARVFRRFTSAAGLREASILTPDVGGLALCCDEFKIVDLAALSNRKLAHRGRTALAEVLETESPELVDAHWRWTWSGAVYELPYFRAHYVPAFAGETRLWLRRDVAEAIERNGRGCWVPVGRGDIREALRTHRYAWADFPEDRKSFEAPGIVLALNQGDPFAETVCK